MLLSLAFLAVMTFGCDDASSDPGDATDTAQDRRDTAADSQADTAPDMTDTGSDDTGAALDTATGDTAADATECPSGTVACGDFCIEDDPRCTCEPTMPTTFTDDVLPVLGTNCSGCHSWVDDYDSILTRSSFSLGCGGRPYVTPHSIDDSYMLQKIVPSGDRCDDQMPLRSTMSADQVDVVRQWICQGAVE